MHWLVRQLGSIEINVILTSCMHFTVQRKRHACKIFSLSQSIFDHMYPHALLTWDVVQNRMPPLHKTVDHIYHL
uniref:Uncharacterized protein n=1 Tax=Oryza nivara TaxID=4536 RepID=A0A0E0I9R3_ORYNI